MGKATKTDIEQRVNQIYKLLLTGTSRLAILQFAAKNWGVSERSTDGYIARARELMREAMESDRQMALGEELAFRNELIYEALQVKNYQLALKLANSRARLLGLFNAYEMASDDRLINELLRRGYVVIDPRLGDR